MEIIIFLEQEQLLHHGILEPALLPFEDYEQAIEYERPLVAAPHPRSGVVPPALRLAAEASEEDQDLAPLFAEPLIVQAPSGGLEAGIRQKSLNIIPPP